MTKNTITDMNNILFETLEYLNDRDIVITDLTVDNLVWTCYELIVDEFIAAYEQLI